MKMINKTLKYKNIKSNLNSIKLKIIGLIVLLVSINSCYSSSGLNKSLLSTNLDVIIYDEMELYISKAFFSETAKCLEIEEQNQIIKKTFKKNELDQRNEVNFRDSTSRAILIAPNISNFMPSRLYRSEIDLQYGICINHSGEVVLGRFIYSKQKLNRSEEARIMKAVFKYKFESRPKQTCLKCCSFRFQTFRN